MPAKKEGVTPITKIQWARAIVWALQNAQYACYPQSISKGSVW